MSCRNVHHYSSLVVAVDGCQHLTPTCPSELYLSLAHLPLRPPCPYFLIRFRPNLTDKLDLCKEYRLDAIHILISYLISHLYHLCIDPITPTARHGRTGSYLIQHSATANGHSTHTSHRPPRLFFDRRQVAHRYLRIDLGLYTRGPHLPSLSK